MSATCRCSFCGRSQNDVPRLVATEAGTAAICVECVLAVIDTFAVDREAEELFVLTDHGRDVAQRLAAEGCR